MLALTLVAYLRNKADLVVCECRHQILLNRASRYEIYITRVVLDGSPQVKHGRAPSSPASKEKALAQISPWGIRALTVYAT
ncbi:CaiF/GrlA family transcriptional regulator [Salmonella enterica]|nr:CaiF/GrlA family transcriptional regulator [Salmonella enterica]